MLQNSPYMFIYLPEAFSTTSKLRICTLHTHREIIVALVVRPAGLIELRKPNNTLYILRFPLYIISDVKVTLPVTLKFSLEILIYPQVIQEVIVLGHFLSWNYPTPPSSVFPRDISNQQGRLHCTNKLSSSIGRLCAAPEGYLTGAQGTVAFICILRQYTFR